MLKNQYYDQLIYKYMHEDITQLAFSVAFQVELTQFDGTKRSEFCHS